ncbi:MAG: Fic family protein [Candidatus Pacearchaeota archaeon]
MSYIEKRTINQKDYYYFTKKVRFMNKTFTIKKNTGKNITKEKYILDNLEDLTNKELEFKLIFLDKIKEDLSYNKELSQRIEKKSILINNLLEAKNIKKIIDLEFAKEFIFNSNNIEGSKIPPETVREIIEKGDTKYFQKNEIKEVKNSILAFEYIQKSFKFNVNSIKRLYHILTKDLYREGNQEYPKGFKKISNVVGNSQTTPPEEVEIELDNLLKWYKKNKNLIHPLILAFEFHKRYEKIHPFIDGNGRTGRMIMNKILISSGYYPIIIFKTNKQTYFNSLEQDEKIKKYYQFMLEQIEKTYDYILQIISKY